jgi:hypothetical protein
MAASSARARAALNLPKPPAARIKRAQVILAAVTNNAYLPSLRPPLIKLSADIAGADAAETVAKGKAPGSATVRNDKCATMVIDLQQVCAYVQEVADATPAIAEQIIESAALAVAKAHIRTKPAFAATPGAVSGTIDLAVKAAGRRASYEWQSSPDQKTWTTLPVTVKASAHVGGLTPGAFMTFRYRVVTAAGEGDWSQVLSIFVK